MIEHYVSRSAADHCILSRKCLIARQVAIGCAGLRALGYLLRHYVTNGEELPKHLLTPIVNVSSANRTCISDYRHGVTYRCD